MIAPQFAHLQNPATAGQQPIVCSMADYVPFSGVSDQIASGVYEFETIGHEVKAKKSGSGTNFSRTDRVVGPAGCPQLGAKVITIKPVPTSGAADDAGLNMWRDLVYAYGVHDGKLDAYKALPSLPITLTQTVGRRFFASIEQKPGDDGRVWPEIVGFLTPESFQATAGPRAASATASQPVQQTQRPDLGATAPAPANGRSLIDQKLGLGGGAGSAGPSPF